MVAPQDEVAGRMDRPERAGIAAAPTSAPESTSSQLIIRRPTREALHRRARHRDQHLLADPDRARRLPGRPLRRDRRLASLGPLVRRAAAGLARDGRGCRLRDRREPGRLRAARRADAPGRLGGLARPRPRRPARRRPGRHGAVQPPRRDDRRRPGRLRGRARRRGAGDRREQGDDRGRARPALPPDRPDRRGLRRAADLQGIPACRRRRPAARPLPPLRGGAGRPDQTRDRGRRLPDAGGVAHAQPPHPRLRRPDERGRGAGRHPVPVARPRLSLGRHPGCRRQGGGR